MLRRSFRVGYFVTCTGNYETGAGRYVERIFPVAARTDYIYRREFAQVYAYAAFAQGFPEPDEFFDRYRSHFIHGEECGDLCFVV